MSFILKNFANLIKSPNVTILATRNIHVTCTSFAKNLGKTPVIPINDLPADFANKEEGILRCKLAALYRLVDKYGLTYGIYNHISVRCPDNESHFLINVLGLNYEEVTASNLVKVDSQGNIVSRGSTPYGINRAGFVLHSAIHEARTDLNCVIHAHTPAGAAISTLKARFLPISQEAMIRQFFLGYHDYEGILLDENFKKKIAEDLGDRNRVMLLHNHGVVSCGNTIEEAWSHFYDLIYACETQCRALSAAGANLDNLIIPSEEVQTQVIETLLTNGGVNSDSELRWGIGDMEFEAEMRYLDYRGYKTGYPYKIKPQYLQD